MQTCFLYLAIAVISCQWPGKRGTQTRPIQSYSLALTPGPIACGVSGYPEACVNAQPWGVHYHPGGRLWALACVLPPASPQTSLVQTENTRGLSAAFSHFPELKSQSSELTRRNRQRSFSCPPPCKILAQGLTRRTQEAPLHTNSHIPSWVGSTPWQRAWARRDDHLPLWVLSRKG